MIAVKMMMIALLTPILNLKIDILYIKLANLTRFCSWCHSLKINICDNHGKNGAYPIQGVVIRLNNSLFYFEMNHNFLCVCVLTVVFFLQLCLLLGLSIKRFSVIE